MAVTMKTQAFSAFIDAKVEGGNDMIDFFDEYLRQKQGCLPPLPTEPELLDRGHPHIIMPPSEDSVLRETLSLNSDRLSHFPLFTAESLSAKVGTINFLGVI